jgi:radical SAM superfamily enzyme YgiQ (UPF0313 family)
MSILLIRPPSLCRKGAARPSIGLPLGLLYIAAFLEQKGHKVHLYDAQVNLQSPVRLNEGSNIHLGDSWEIIEEKIARLNPAVVGITVPFSTQVPYACRVAELVKRINKRILVVVGGNQPTVKPEDFFTLTQSVDVVCFGEGEFPMAELVRKFIAGEAWDTVFSTAVRGEAGIRSNAFGGYIEALDTLPLPAYHLINLEDYFALNAQGFGGRPLWEYPGQARSVSVITSRGCPYECIFCSIHLHMGRKWRAHSAEYVLKHLAWLKEKYQLQHIHFEDDNLTFDARRFEDILRGMITTRLGMRWDTPNGIRADSLTKKLLSLSKESGCTYVIFGVESGSTRVLREVIHKRLDLMQVRQAARWAKELRIDTMAFFVIGFPGETFEEMCTTVVFALMLMRKYDVSPTVFLATPLAGTRLFEICKEKGYLRKEVTPEALALTTGGNAQESLIATKLFGVKEIEMVLHRFSVGYKKVFLLLLARYLFRYPRLAVEVIRRLSGVRHLGLKDALAKVVMFKYCYLDVRPLNCIGGCDRVRINKYYLKD